MSGQGTTADAARNWLTELRVEVGQWGATDYRSTEYRGAVDAVLALLRRDYIENALAALEEAEARAERHRQALDAVCDELLGVPDGDYPGPVTTAYRIARVALAADRQDGDA